MRVQTDSTMRHGCMHYSRSAVTMLPRLSSERSDWIGRALVSKDRSQDMKGRMGGHVSHIIMITRWVLGYEDLKYSLNTILLPSLRSGIDGQFSRIQECSRRLCVTWSIEICTTSAVFLFFSSGSFLLQYSTQWKGIHNGRSKR